MDENDKERDLGLEHQDETEEEHIQRVSQTTELPEYGAGITGVRGNVRPRADPTIVLLPHTVNDEGVNDEEPEDDDAPEEDEDT